MSLTAEPEMFEEILSYTSPYPIVTRYNYQKRGRRIETLTFHEEPSDFTRLTFYTNIKRINFYYPVKNLEPFLKVFPSIESIGFRIENIFYEFPSFNTDDTYIKHVYFYYIPYLNAREWILTHRFSNVYQYSFVDMEDIDLLFAVRTLQMKIYIQDNILYEFENIFQNENDVLQHLELIFEDVDIANDPFLDVFNPPESILYSFDSFTSLKFLDIRQKRDSLEQYEIFITIPESLRHLTLYSIILDETVDLSNIEFLEFQHVPLHRMHIIFEQNIGHLENLRVLHGDIGDFPEIVFPNVETFEEYAKTNVVSSQLPNVKTYSLQTFQPNPTKIGFIFEQFDRLEEFHLIDSGYTHFSFLTSNISTLPKHIKITTNHLILTTSLVIQFPIKIYLYGETRLENKIRLKQIFPNSTIYLR